MVYLAYYDKNGIQFGNDVDMPFIAEHAEYRMNKYPIMDADQARLGMAKIINIQALP